MIFFDIDNTLLDDRTAQAAAALALYHANDSLQKQYAESTFAGIWKDAVHKNYQQYKAGKLTFGEHRLESVRTVFNAPLNHPDALLLLDVYNTAYKDNWQLYPDVIPALEKYKTVTKGIISNGDTDEQKEKLRKTGIDSYFDIILISDDIGVFKPDPAIFLKAVEMAGKDPSQCYYLGDKVATDAKAAQDAGLVGIWMNRRIVDPKTEKVPELISLNDLVYSE